MNTTSSIWFPALALAAAVALGAALPARADVSSDIVYLTGTPVIVAPEGGAPGSELFLNFAPPPPISHLDGVVLFYEDASLTTVSDQIWLQNDFFSFASDPDLQTLTLPVLGQLVEDGTIQEVSSYFGFAQANTVAVQSDVGSDTDAVPEPASLAVLALSAPAMLLRKRKGVRSAL